MSTDEDQNQQPPSAGPSQGRRVDRRTFVKGSLAAGGLIAAGGLGIDRFADASEDSGQNAARSAAASVPPPPTPAQPNILVILVDQLRYPAWFSPTADGAGLPPNLRRLRQGAVSFAGHYTASNDCTPGALDAADRPLHAPDGLHDHRRQTLDPGFPTWGTMLREHGYQTRWYGKWHLTHTTASGVACAASGRSRATASPAARSPRRTAPPARAGVWTATSPSSSAGGSSTSARRAVVHDRVVRQPARHRLVVRVERPRGGGGERAPVTEGLPANFETPGLLIERGKPMLQRSLQETAAASFGPVPFEGPEVVALWSDFLNLYAKLQREVDRHIGHVLDTLDSRPDVAANTVDRVHIGPRRVRRLARSARQGRGSLRGGDPRAAARQGLPRTADAGARSAAHAADLERRHRPAAADDRHRLGTTGAANPTTTHLAERADLAAILADPAAPGRPFVAARDRRDGDRVRDRTVRGRRAAPRDRRAHARGQVRDVLATGRPAGSKLIPGGQEEELYDYSTSDGRLELHNSAGHSALQPTLSQTFEQALEKELRRPLPPRLNGAHARGFSRLLPRRQDGGGQRRVRARAARRKTVRRAAGTGRGDRRNALSRRQARFARETPITAPVASSACTAT